MPSSDYSEPGWKADPSSCEHNWQINSWGVTPTDECCVRCGTRRLLSRQRDRRSAVEKLSVIVHRHKNRRWSVYLTLPDGSTEQWRGVLDVRNVDAAIWKRLQEMEG